MHILHLPFFFFTGTVLASQVGYFTSLMTFASRSLWTSALTAATLSSDILRSFCFLGFIFGSISSLCSMMSRLTPRRSFADQAKTSLFLFRNSKSSHSSSGSRAALIVTCWSGNSYSSGTFFYFALLLECFFFVPFWLFE